MVFKEHLMVENQLYQGGTLRLREQAILYVASKDFVQQFLFGPDKCKIINYIEVPNK